MQRAAAVPVKDARLGEKVCLAVVFRAGKSVAPDELLAHLDAAGLSKFDMPEYFLTLDEIPLTPNGKMLKRAIADDIAQGRVTPLPVRWQAKQASSRRTTCARSWFANSEASRTPRSATCRSPSRRPARCCCRSNPPRSISSTW